MPRFQITFKGKEIDVTISADSAKEAVDEYKKLTAELGSLDVKPLKPRRGASVLPKQKSGRHASPKGTRSKILELKTEGFFKMGRSLQEIQEALAKKGITVPVTEISPYLPGLVRSGHLDRDRVMVEKRKVWMYKEKLGPGN